MKRAFIPIVYIAKPNEEQQMQWRNACKEAHVGNCYIHPFERVDDKGNVHQIVVMTDKPNESVYVSAMRYVRSFKAYAPFVLCKKPVFVENLSKEELNRLLD